MKLENATSIDKQSYIKIQKDMICYHISFTNYMCCNVGF